MMKRSVFFFFLVFWLVDAVKEKAGGRNKSEDKAVKMSGRPMKGKMKSTTAPSSLPSNMFLSLSF